MTERLVPQEAVVIDLDKVRSCRATDVSGASGSRIDGLVAALCEAELAWAGGRFDALDRLAASMVQPAEDLGMTTFAALASDLRGLPDRPDPVALAARLSRLVRVGEASLAAVWDLEDLRL